MSVLAATAHFAGAPDWKWWILIYFFLAGLAGGSYFLGTLLRYWGTAADQPLARLAYYVPLPAVLLGLLMLTIDLRKPLRFWHMLFNTTPGAFGLNFNSTTPMSIGVWALLVASIFALVAFIDSLVRDDRIRGAAGGRLVGFIDAGPGRIWSIIGSVIFLFVAGYTGVLLAVSNQPVWSDSWALGGLFLASGLTGSVALLLLLARWRGAAAPSLGFLEIGGRLFTLLELALLVVVGITLIDDGTLDTALDFPWILLWIVAVVGMLPGLVGFTTGGLNVRAGGTATAARVSTWALAPWLVLIGVLALRAAVIWSAQS